MLEAAGIAPAQLTPMPPRRLPPLLRLPTRSSGCAAARMLRIDAKARSSMADDLALGRATEIDALCGEVVRLAQSHGMQAPLNARMRAGGRLAGPPRTLAGAAVADSVGVVASFAVLHPPSAGAGAGGAVGSPLSAE